METVTAWEAHVVECSECCEGMLVRDPIQKGDIVVCPRCKTKSKIDGICGACREDKKTQTHDGEPF